jgi:hypothetical protein
VLVGEGKQIRGDGALNGVLYARVVEWARNEVSSNRVR